jgi:hypothetical protein
MDQVYNPFSDETKMLIALFKGRATRLAKYKPGWWNDWDANKAGKLPKDNGVRVYQTLGPMHGNSHGADMSESQVIAAFRGVTLRGVTNLQRILRLFIDNAVVEEKLLSGMLCYRLTSKGVNLYVDSQEDNQG